MMIASTEITAPVIAASLATLGLVVGWFVIGTQRVTEELTKERRQAYVALLAKVDEVLAARRAPFERLAGSRSPAQTRDRPIRRRARERVRWTCFLAPRNCSARPRCTSRGS